MLQHTVNEEKYSTNDESNNESDNSDEKDNHELYIKRSKQSAFMIRQQDKLRKNGLSLSPLEEIKVAQSQLEAENANAIHKNELEKTHHIEKRRKSSIQTVFDATVLPLIFSHHIEPSDDTKQTSSSKRIAPKEAADIDELSPNQALLYVEEVKRQQDLISKRKEHLYGTKKPFYILSPLSKFRKLRDIMCFTLITYEAIVIPLQIAFTGQLQDMFFGDIDTIISYFFGCDIMLHFLTAYSKNGKYVCNPKDIAINYIKTWLIVDLLALFPFNYVITTVDTNGVHVANLPRLLRLFRLFRLVRIVTLKRLVGRLENAMLIQSTFNTFFHYGFIILITAHWLGCGFFAMSMRSETNSWANYYHFNTQTFGDQYVASVYWAVMTMTTVGYGDISPKTTDERIFVILAMFIGAFTFAYGMTNIVSMLLNSEVHEKNFKIKMDMINDYMKVRDLPEKLQDEIRTFFHSSRQTNNLSLSKEGILLNELSALLRSKVALSINDSFLTKMELFTGIDQNFIMEIALSMRMVCFSAFENVILEGEIGEEMFFIARGVVQVLRGNVKLNVLGENQYFGEMAILTQDCRRRATVKTLSFCELRMLTREKFLLALSHYPLVKERMSELIKERVKSIAQLDSGDTTKAEEKIPPKMVSIERINEKNHLKSIIQAKATSAKRNFKTILSSVKSARTVPLSAIYNSMRADTEIFNSNCSMRDRQNDGTIKSANECENRMPENNGCSNVSTLYPNIPPKTDDDILTLLTIQAKIEKLYENQHRILEDLIKIEEQLDTTRKTTVNKITN